MNQSKADNSILANCFDNIDVYTYNYTPQYALENGKSDTATVYGWIVSNQFGTICDNPQSFPNGKIPYEGERQVIDDLNTLNKKDLTILLWAKVKEQDRIINEMKTVVDKLTRSSSFKEFKS